MRTLIPALLGAALVLVLIGGLGASAPHPDAPANGCDKCHACEKPTAADPCLVLCPRRTDADHLSPALGPDIVILDDLEDLYVAVRFDHKKHATMSGMAAGCEACHHYSPPNSTHPECKSCHPVRGMSADIEQPGLKGAYHRQCMNCHTDWDHETKCEVCHEKKAGGRLQGTATEVCEHSHYEPIELSELIVFDTGYADGDKVPFHHRNHSQKYERDCTECHQQQSCTRCHVHGEELHPMGELEDIDLHDTCFRCHDQETCTDCHGRAPDDLFQHAETGWPLRAYHAKLNCRACHGPSGAFRKLTPVCENCHAGDWPGPDFDHEVTGVRLNEVHRELDCLDCHVGGVGTRAACDGCHDDGRAYDKKMGFGAGQGR